MGCGGVPSPHGSALYVGGRVVGAAVLAEFGSKPFIQKCDGDGDVGAPVSGQARTWQCWNSGGPCTCVLATPTCVGVGVGTGVFGSSVGTGVGLGVGTGVGEGVGLGVGLGVGAGVGEGVGMGVGKGTASGVCVGSLVGGRVGTGDGDGVVGMGVGGKVALPEVGDAVKHGGNGHIESLGAGVRLVLTVGQSVGAAVVQTCDVPRHDESGRFAPRASTQPTRRVWMPEPQVLEHGDHSLTRQQTSL